MIHKETYDFFPDAAIADWVRSRLGNYHKWEQVASLSLGDSAERSVPAKALIKFGELALALELPVTQAYSTMSIMRPVPDDKQREYAISEMRSAYERGEIDADGHTVTA